MSEQDTRERINAIRAHFGAEPTTMTDEQIEVGQKVYGAKHDCEVVIVDELQDTREQLEADVRGWYSHTMSTHVWPSDKNKSTDVLMVPEDTVLSWLDRQAAITKTEIAEYYNLQPDTSSQTARNADSYNLDTREQLEADIKAELKDFAGEFIGRTLVWYMARDWLDRQEAITSREWCHSHDALEEELDRVRAERDELEADWGQLLDEKYMLKADVKRWMDAANEQRLVAMEQADMVEELTAERDQLSRDLDAEHALVIQFEYDNERLREAIDAMNNGQFYSMYKAKCEECEQLKKVVRTQADSFKKLEIELAGKDG